MLIVMIALVSLANSILGQLILFGEPLSLQRILGAIMMPLAWAMGIDMHEASLCGNLLGTKIALNEVIAFIDLSRLPDAALSVRSRLMMTYALCGFANFSSVGIQVGALGTMAPERQTEITELGMKAMLAGSLSSFMSATLVGLLY
jgi:CNT family concentrative nucleoside transporter